MTKAKGTFLGDPFRTDHLQHDLRMHGLRGAAATLAGQTASACIQVGSVAVLARLLRPSDFGTFSKTVALTGIIALIQTGGLSLATIQRAQVTHRQVSTLFWLNIVFGLACALTIMASANGVAWFYNDPRLVPLVIALAGPCVLSSLGVQHAALLQRQLRFNELSVINLVCQFAGLVGAIVSASSGAGYWAFVVQQYVVSATIPILLFFAARWTPGKPDSLGTVKPLLSIGFNQTGFNVLNFASRNFDNVLIGRFVSDAVLGFYSQAYRLLLLPIQQFNSPVSSVVVPVLARLQEQPERYVRFYLKALGGVVFFGMPLVCFILVDAKLIVLLLLGRNWLEVVPIFHALGVAAFLGTFNIATGWVFSSLGRTNRQLKWQLAATPVTILAFFVGLHWGAIGVAASFSAMQLVTTPFRLWYSFRDTPIRFRKTLGVLFAPASAAFAASAVLMICHVAVWRQHINTLFLDVFVFGTAYLGAWSTTQYRRAELRGVFDALLSVVKELKTATSFGGK